MLSENEVFLIKDRDFFSLLVSLGVEKWYGIQTDEDYQKPVSSAQLNRILVSLYQSGFVDWDEQHAIITPDFRKLFQGLKEAKRFIYARTTQPEPFGITYYVGDLYVVRMERSLNDHEMLRIGMMTKTKCAETLQDVFFHKDVTPVENIQPEDDLPYVLSQPIEQEDMYEHRYLSVLEAFSAATGTMKQRIVIQDKNAYEKVLIQDANKTRCISNDEKSQRNLIMYLLEGKEIP